MGGAAADPCDRKRYNKLPWKIQGSFFINVDNIKPFRPFNPIIDIGTGHGRE